jgi:hypothetical protein
MMVVGVYANQCAQALEAKAMGGRGGEGRGGGAEMVRWRTDCGTGPSQPRLLHSLPHPPNQCALHVRAHWCARHNAVGAAYGTATSLIPARVHFFSRHSLKAFQS